VISEVVLVPGLWMPGAVMALIASRLRRAGYQAQCFGYRGRDNLQANLERLARHVEGRTVHFVGHSLGGVLIYDLLQKYPSMPCGKVVLLGAPVRGCFAGRRLGSDRRLADGLDRMIDSGIRALVDRFHDELAGLVTGTIERWDATETSSQLELLLGRDLQYIRINGTVVGAGVGLILHAVVQGLG